MKLDRWEEAETATQKSIDVRPDHYDAFVQLAEIQKHLDKKEAALKSIEKAVSLMDENDEEEISKNYIYQLYADILLLNNMQDKADAIQMKIK
jgi:tetratricopeptide (TPR) repeat protein